MVTSHELRLIGHSTIDGAPQIQAYCPCGWIGTRTMASQPDVVAAEYKAHKRPDPDSKGAKVVVHS